MNKTDIQKRINGLNEFMLSNSTKELLLLKISNDYTYNKAVALINKNTKNKEIQISRKRYRKKETNKSFFNMHSCNFNCIFNY